jgi:TonB family protein
MKNVSRSSLAALVLLLLSSTSSRAIESDRPANRPAQPSTTVAPAYPYLMRHLQAAAEVTVAFTVDAQGKVTKAKIAHSSNHEFNEAALAAIKQWSFKPALKNGQAVETKLAQKFNFSVQDQLELKTRTMLAAEKAPR